MAVFSPSTRLTSSVIDPRQRVNYTLGMVLGVDDFVQESTWHSEALRQVSRDLIGYGTVRGLRVSLRSAGDEGPEVVVDPGIAITPKGELARVSSQQCALINEWLDTGGLVDEEAQRAHRDALDIAVGTPNTGTVRLYVVLDYAECTGTPRPIPGEPCRSEDDVLVDSRIKDGFALALRLTAPQQVEHEGARDFAAWLARVPVADIAVASGALAQFLEAIRQAANAATTPPFMQGAIPPGIVIPRTVASDWYRAALRVYVTELRARPAWLAAGQDATGSAPKVDAAESGLLLAALDLSVLKAGDIWRLEAVPTAVVVDDSQRPILLSSDFHEEQLLRSGASSGVGPRSAIVAAGLVTVVAAGGGVPPATPNTLGALAAQVHAPGAVRVLFTPVPFPSVQYLIQATPVQADSLAQARVVSATPAVAAEVPGDTRVELRLNVRRGDGSPVLDTDLAGMQLMVQVLAFSTAAA